MEDALAQDFYPNGAKDINSVGWFQECKLYLALNYLGQIVAFARHQSQTPHESGENKKPRKKMKNERGGEE